MSKLAANPRGAWGHSNEPLGQEQLDSNDYDGPQTPEPAYSEAHGKQPAPSSSSEVHHNSSSKSSSSSTALSMLAAASSLLQKVPGARRVSLFNATLLGLLGLAAALTALGGGFSALLVLLARWYLPAQRTHASLPIHFDYAAGPSAAGAWLPLLRQSPFTAVLTPPQHQQAMSAAAAALSFQGNLGPGGSFSVASSDGLASEGSGFGRQLGFLGLGFGPASRAKPLIPTDSRQRKWLDLGFGRRRKGSSNSKAAADGTKGGAAFAAGGVDVGSGVVVPESEWLVPSWGRISVAVELEMPRHPEPDLVQLTGELVSQQGVVLARTTRTWVPKPRPLFFRIADFFIFGPWRALGLRDDSVRVQLPLFHEFQNPQPPPGGWGSVAGLKPAKAGGAAARECIIPVIPGEAGEPGTESSSRGSRVTGGKDDAAAAAEAEDGAVAGPRAMWLRVTMIGRSVGYGPPRVYRAAAHLHTRLGFLDRLAVALRPSLSTALMLLAASLAVAVGGTATAAVLLALAYSLYRWGTPSSAEARQYNDDRQYSDGRTAAAAAAAADGANFGQKQQQAVESDESGEGYYEPGYEPGFSAVGFEGSSLPGVGVEAGYVEAEESGVYAADKALRALSPASFDDNAAEHEQEKQQLEYSGAYDMYTSPSQQKQQQQQLDADISSRTTAEVGGSHPSGGTVSAIGRMFGWKEEQQQQQGAADDKWKEQLLAESANEQQQQQNAPAAAASKQQSAAEAAAAAVAAASKTAALAAAADEEISSATAGAFKRAGFAYHL